jgi:flagellar basal body rod protein FlgG
MNEQGTVDREDRTGRAADAHVVISNNLANVNTNGFKKGRAVFEDLIYQNVRQPGAQSRRTRSCPRV